MLRIPAELEKGHRDRLLAMVPEFGEFLLAASEADRRGRVFRPLAMRGGVASLARVGKLVSLIGKKARVVVYTHPITGAVKYASAHDLRRSFGERWSTRLNTATLMELMRHESIQTTMRFYLGRNAERTADAVWSAYEQQDGSGTTNENAPGLQPEGVDVTACEGRGF